MKKFLLLPILASLFLFSACTFEEYYECPEEHSILISDIIDVLPNHWSFNDNNDGLYFYSTWNYSALTQDVLNSGAVLAYYWDGTRDNQLPYVRPYQESNGYLYFENIRFDYQQGKITFILEPSDFIEPYAITGKMSFKVVVIKNIRH